MKSLYYMVGLLFMLLQGSLQSPIQETEDKSRSVKAARTEALDDSDQHNEVKRHSQGTFTSDYSKYLDSRRAQDFVQWLMNSKRSGGISKRNVQFERHAEGTYTNDVTQFLEEKAAKEFIDWLIKGKPKKLRLSRHADGTFTSDMSSYLEEKAAKEFVDWLIKGRPKRNFPDLSAEEMDRRHADGSFTSDFNKALDIKAAQEFLDWIINTPVKERDLLEEQ
ncbi:pro-glucagon isoform X1 [Rana temporaria]|uniref:pro-glucagon isoform X1 n=1 Tax=Rana temporaria TaxID=8407 RepID=UPI001AADCB01|nr:pro-glucagon isoform X1 [Rana temporaria]